MTAESVDGTRSWSAVFRLLGATALVSMAMLPVAPGAAGATTDAIVDDFDGPANGAPDGRYWDYDTGQMPGSAQLQTYSNSTDNVRLDGDGHLIIQAVQTPDGLSSGRLVTRGKVEMLYGTMSARIKMPSGQGISPAFWLLGTDVGTTGWPGCGEIDLIEMPNTGTMFHTTIHGPWTEPPPDSPSDYQVRTEGPIEDLSLDYHTYWVRRAPGSIVIGIDDTTLGDFTPGSLAPNQQWVFDRPMFAILNIAVGDNAAGPPDASTPWPATMQVDWFRWQPA